MKIVPMKIVPMKKQDVIDSFLVVGAVVIVLSLFPGCVSSIRYNRDVLANYKKGLKVGRVIGRDEILYRLDSPQCFKQNVDELMKPSAYDKEPK